MYQKNLRFFRLKILEICLVVYTQYIKDAFMNTDEEKICNDV